MTAVQYVSFDQLAPALDYVKDRTERFRFIAGGTDLVVQMRSGKTTAESLVDISRVGELRGIHEAKDCVIIGALSTIEDIRRSPLVERRFPALKEAADVFAAWQVRNLATLGGNVCNASPAADTALPLLVYRAKLIAFLGIHQREIPIEGFFRGPGKTCLEAGELVGQIILPMEASGGSAFLKLGKRQASILAVVNVAAYVGTKGGVVTEARLALGSVAPTPVRASKAEEFLVGKPAVDKNFTQAAALVDEDIKPITDVRAGAKYRVRMAKTLAFRALRLASARARRSSA